MKAGQGKFAISPLAALSLLLLCARCWALEPQTLFNFQLGLGPVRGALIEAPDGNFYGTSLGGGPMGKGAVFRVTPGGALTILVSDQSGPAAGLVLGNDGLLYGMTDTGGAIARGSIFKVTTNGVLTNVAEFDGTNGENPTFGLVLAADGNFYGATVLGGVNSVGSIFRVTPSGVVTLLFSFDLATSGGAPAGLTLGPDGNLYGSTSLGGSAGQGTIFKITTSGALTTLFSFQTTNGTGGQARLTVGPDGNLYGTTPDGGSANLGTIFRITTNGNFTTLVSFTKGAKRKSELSVGADGQLYGTTERGGSADLGTVFKVTTNGVLTTLVSFTDPGNGSPLAGLLLASDGNFYGCSQGSVFRMTAGGVLTHLVSVLPLTGIFPQAGLMLGPDGNFYGTTSSGGSNSVGTIFRLAPNGVLTSLFSFNRTNGASPQGGLALGRDGNFYGTTAFGGPNDLGTIFRFSTNGTLTTLASFDGSNGANPQFQLVMDANGNFYGVTTEGGADGVGTVFRVTTNGVLTTLATFNDIAGGVELPRDGLTAGQDGNFYGTTAAGGSQLAGTVFKITPGGSLTTLVSFNAANGTSPLGGLVQANDGNLYGTTGFGGTNSTFGTNSGFGTIFKVTTNGVLTTLFNFHFTDGEAPSAKLIFGSDGNLYGTTEFGGSTGGIPAANGFGTVFRITTNGVFTSLSLFQRTNGSNLQAPLVLGIDGNLYGTTSEGGTGSGGTIFRLVLNANFYDGVDLTDPAQTEADGDGDGVTNLVEYALGTDPRNPGDGNAAMAADLITVGVGRHLALQYKRRVDATALHLQYLPEVSADRTNWFSDNAHVLGVSVTPVDSEFDLVTVRDATPVSAAEPRFIRLRIVFDFSQSTSAFWIGTDTAILGNGGSASKFTAFSQRMVGPVEFAGKITAVQDATLTDTNAVWLNGQFGTNGTPAYVEFDNGIMVDIANSFAATRNLVLAGNLSGIASVGTAYRIRPHFTIASLFGTNNETGLKSGLNPSQADTIILQIPQTQQTLTIFYFSNAIAHGWFEADFTPAANQVVYPEQGVLVRRIVPGNLDLFLSGPVKTGVTVAPIEPGFNLLGTLKSLSSLTLNSLNLFTGDPATGVASGLNPVSGDNVLVIQSNGSAATYFYFQNAAGTQGWFDATFNAADNLPIPPGSAFFVHRKSTIGAFNWTIPAE
jgi:uncharacterized repeat protein (TIGR03803 family)